MSLKLNLKRFGQLEAINFTQLNTSDALQVLQLRNHPEVRRWMHTSNPISEEDHLKYLASLKTNPNKQYFLLTKASSWLGVIAFYTLEAKLGELSLYANKFENQPLAAFILEAAAIELGFNHLGFNALYAEIFANNEQVIRLHKKSGFIQLPTKQADLIRLQLTPDRVKIL